MIQGLRTQATVGKLPNAASPTLSTNGYCYITPHTTANCSVLIVDNHFALKRRKKKETHTRE
jgi:hypothetical protein